uniref:Uncharacterized protein n=1 Tax=Rhizophora mucronata TaxID=61149 RepID=A0A2P2NNG6_RHIMU
MQKWKFFHLSFKKMQTRKFQCGSSKITGILELREQIGV